MGDTGSGTRAAALTCATALLLAACSGNDDTLEPPEVTGGTGTGTVEPTGDATEVPDPVPTTLAGPGQGETDATEQPDGTDQTGATDGPDAGEGGPSTERTVLTRLEFEIPAGWQVEDLGDAEAADPQAGEIPPHLWCLVPPGDLPPIENCGGVVVAIGGDWLPGSGGSRYQPNQPQGWWWGTGDPVCPSWEDQAGEDGQADEAGEPEEPDAAGEQGEAGEEPAEQAVTDNDGLPLTSHTTMVGERAVRYETWRVTCEESEEVLTPQVWHFPELNVLVKDYYGHPDTVAVLHGLEGA